MKIKPPAGAPFAAKLVPTVAIDERTAEVAIRKDWILDSIGLIGEVDKVVQTNSHPKAHDVREGS